MQRFQREQAIEPSAIEHHAGPNISKNYSSYHISVSDTSPSSFPCINEESSKIKQKRFLPDRESRIK